MVRMEDNSSFGQVDHGVVRDQPVNSENHRVPTQLGHIEVDVFLVVVGQRKTDGCLPRNGSGGAWRPVPDRKPEGLSGSARLLNGIWCASANVWSMKERAAPESIMTGTFGSLKERQLGGEDKADAVGMRRGVICDIT
jgi:hypothetical protein